MKGRALVVTVLALGMSSFACQPPAQEAAGLSEEDMAAIRNMMQAHVDAVLASDVAAAVLTYTEDAVQMPPNAPITEGRAALQEWFGEFPATTDYGHSIVDVDGRDGIAYTRSNYSATFMVEGTPVTDQGKALAIWRKQDGTWLIATAIWNSDLPLPEDGAETAAE